MNIHSNGLPVKRCEGFVEGDPKSRPAFPSSGQPGLASRRIAQARGERRERRIEKGMRAERDGSKILHALSLGRGVVAMARIATKAQEVAQVRNDLGGEYRGAEPFDGDGRSPQEVSVPVASRRDV